MIDRARLMRQITEAITADPMLVGDITQLCMQHWQQYLVQLAQHREQQHLYTLQTTLQLLGVRRRAQYNEVELALLLDPAAYAYPQGLESAQCFADRAFLQRFAESARQLGWQPESQFIRQIKGQEHWLRQLYQSVPATEDNAGDTSTSSAPPAAR